jgi:hypothetical protein
MNEFDKCNFCCSYEYGYCHDDEHCHNHQHYRIDVYKLIAKANELGISVTDLLNIMREVNE